MRQWSGLRSLAKDKLEAALAGDKIEPTVRQVLKLRLEAAGSAVKKIPALLNWAGADDRVRGCFLYHRASPGRWAGTGPQPQNLKRIGDLDFAPVLQAIATGDHRKLRRLGNPLALIGQCLRPMIIARKGARLIGADYSGIEARVAAWVTGEKWLIDAFKEEDRGGPSVYAIVAARIFRRRPEAIGKGSPEREVGKRCVLAFLYAGGLGA